MSYVTFVNLLSIAVGFVAALYFGVGSALLSREEISKVSGTMWDGNQYFRAFLLATKAEYLCGSVALCIAFALQFAANVPNLLPGGTLCSSSALGALLSLAVSAGVGVALWFWRGRIRAKLGSAP